ncbi:MAG: hypothetical protein U0936_24060 [Planctomycetaceae bacterium]
MLKQHDVPAIEEQERFAACQKIATNPEQALKDAHTAYAARLDDLFGKLPRLESGNPELERPAIALSSPVDESLGRFGVCPELTTARAASTADASGIIYGTSEGTGNSST